MEEEIGKPQCKWKVSCHQNQHLYSGKKNKVDATEQREVSKYSIIKIGQKLISISTIISRWIGKEKITKSAWNPLWFRRYRDW